MVNHNFGVPPGKPPLSICVKESLREVGQKRMQAAQAEPVFFTWQCSRDVNDFQRVYVVSHFTLALFASRCWMFQIPLDS